MRRIRRACTAALGALSLGLSSVACDADYNYMGYSMYDYFPLDGSARDWTYINEDQNITWSLFVEMQEPSMVGNVEQVVLEHSRYDTSDLLMAVTWSSDSSNGVLIHGYENYELGTSATFDPPVVFAEDHMAPGDTAVTSTGGYEFTATFDLVTGCATEWTTSWGDDDNCLKITLQDEDGMASTNGEFTGSYWVVPRYGIAWWESDYYGGRWNLSHASWQED